jgi:hypothetical protein
MPLLAVDEAHRRREDIAKVPMSAARGADQGRTIRAS